MTVFRPMDKNANDAEVQSFLRPSAVIDEPDNFTLPNLYVTIVSESYSIAVQDSKVHISEISSTQHMQQDMMEFLNVTTISLDSLTLRWLGEGQYSGNISQRKFVLLYLQEMN
jgi:hypothetical protein